MDAPPPASVPDSARAQEVARRLVALEVKLEDGAARARAAVDDALAACAARGR